MMEESFKDKLVAAVSIEPPIKGAQIVERIIQLCMEELVAGDNSLKAALDKEKAQPSPSCGRVFDRAELIYHCNDCAVDETCVLCSGCFQKADHEGHDYHYYVSRGDGGSCDCGELESWKKTLSCSYHQITQTEALRSPSSPVLLDRLESIYSLVLHIIGDYLEQIVTKTVYMTDKPSFSVILFNDERHNFQEVIHEVSMATQKPLAFGENIAREVDQQGMTSVFNFTTLEDKPIAEEIKGRFLRIRLLSMIEPTEFLIGRLICNGLFQFLLHMAKNYPSLREPLYRELCAKNHNFFDGSKSILEFIFVNDDQFWKSARKSWQNLLTAGLQFDFLKQCLLSCFLIHTNSIIAQKASDREPHLSMTHFAVQILTVPSIAMAAAQRDYVMETYNGLRDYGVGMRRGGRVDNVLEVAGDLIQIGRHVLTDSSVTQSRILEKADNYTCAFDIMEAFQGLFPKEILLREHVEFESPLWMEELNLSYMLYALCEDFARGLGQTRDLIETCIFKKIGGYQWADSPKKRSFQQPLLWLVSFFLPLYLKLTDQPCDLDSSITHAALRSINFLAEVKSGLWVRNGATVRGQVFILLSHIVNLLSL